MTNPYNYIVGIIMLRSNVYCRTYHTNSSRRYIVKHRLVDKNANFSGYYFVVITID